MRTQRRKLIRATGVLLGLLAAGVAGGAGFVYLGIYNISALEQHTTPVFRLLETAMGYSVRQRAEHIEVPDLSRPDWRRAGLGLYEQHCRQCHGAPGVGPEPFALGMLPLPAAIVEVARERPPEDIFWLIKNGVKMSGMPAWKYRLSEEEIWQITAFVEYAPDLRPLEYVALAEAVAAETGAPSGFPPPGLARLGPAGPSAEDKGKEALRQYGCPTCHRIPGITGSATDVGPPLAGIASRSYIAGVLANTDENMVRWLRFPQRVDPKTAMPYLGVQEDDARNITAYLNTLEAPEGEAHPDVPGIDVPDVPEAQER